MPSGMKRPGYAPHHSSTAQSLYACNITCATSLSRDSVNVRALKPAMVGKFIDASTPLAFMSRTRSCTSKQPGRSSENAPGLKPHSSRGQPTVAAMPNGVDVAWPWNHHSSTPLSLRTTFGISSSHFAGTWFSYMSGGSTMWSSMLTRIMSSICTGALLSYRDGQRNSTPRSLLRSHAQVLREAAQQLGIHRAVAQQHLLHRDRAEPAVCAAQRTAVQPARAACLQRPQLEQHPFVGSNRLVEPQAVVDARAARR